MRREGHLRSQQALALYPANSLFVDGYLTTRGDQMADTYRMIEEAGFEVEGNPSWEGSASAQGASSFRVPGGGPLSCAPPPAGVATRWLAVAPTDQSLGFEPPE